MNSKQINTLKLGEFAKVKGGKRMPAGTALISTKTQHPYLRIVDFKDGSIDRSNLQYVPEEVFPAISRYIISFRDLYISIVGTIGLVGTVPKNLSGANLTENAAKICEIDERVIDQAYLAYFLRSGTGQAEINSLTVGSTQPKLALFRIEQINVPCPPLAIQRRISSFLGSLDDRINLLRETNTTLEAIAQALFKSWFVDFDPVRAKAEGLEPEGMDAATAGLFPDSFEESELGLVPSGWKVGKVEDLMELPYGKALKATDRVDGPVPVYGSGGITGCHNESLVNGPSVIVGRKGTVGSLYWEDRPFFPIDTVFYVRTDNPLTYCYYLLQTLGLEDMNTDGAVPGLNRNNAYRLPVVVATTSILESFDEIVSLLRNKMFLNSQHTQTLTQLRDTLLPRLISGQMRLPEAEVMVEEICA